MVGKFGELTLFEHLTKKVWQLNRSPNRLLIVITNLDGFSLVNHGRFTKFTPYQTFPLYGMYIIMHVLLLCLSKPI